MKTKKSNLGDGFQKIEHVVMPLDYFAQIRSMAEAMAKKTKSIETKTNLLWIAEKCENLIKATNKQTAEITIKLDSRGIPIQVYAKNRLGEEFVVGDSLKIQPGFDRYFTVKIIASEKEKQDF